MIQRRDDRVVPNEAAIANVDAALVLEAAAAVDEHVLADADVLAEVGRERREKGERLRDFLAGELVQECSDFVGGVVAAIELGRDAHRFLARSVHGRVMRRAASDGLTVIESGE